MRDSYEDLLYKYGLDVSLSGHVHVLSSERFTDEEGIRKNYKYIQKRDRSKRTSLHRQWNWWNGRGLVQ